MNSKQDKGKGDIIMLEWTHFQEHLKAHIPWVVRHLKDDNNRYLVPPSNKTYVSIDDITKWKEEKLLYMIYKDDKLHSILIRHQFPEQDQIEEDAKYVPIQYRKDGGPRALKNILERIQPNQNKDKKKDNDQNKKQENEQAEIKIVNSFVFAAQGSEELKKKFNAQYAIFERENK